ncbi:11136_t:CDS:2, partial [Cetraspora pellucida]
LVYPMPRPKTVNDILEEFFDFKMEKLKEQSKMSIGRNRGRITKTQEIATRDVTNGIKQYFNEALPICLLYRFERQQYVEMTEKYPKKEMSSIYGAEHLMRLVVKIPDLVHAVQMKEQKAESLEQIFNELARNSQVFSEHPGLSQSANMTSSSYLESPVIIFISSSWISGNKTTCMPVAHNLQSQGYIVVVPDITLYPKGKITEMVSDVQQCIQWTYSHIRHIYLMGHSAGALLSALTVIHDACATLHALPINTTNVKIPVCGHTNGRAGLPRIQGLILFSGVYDTTYHYAYLHQR